MQTYAMCSMLAITRLALHMANVCNVLKARDDTTRLPDSLEHLATGCALCMEQHALPIVPCDIGQGHDRVIGVGQGPAPTQRHWQGHAPHTLWGWDRPMPHAYGPVPHGVVQCPMALSYDLWPCPTSHGLSFVPCHFPNPHEVVRREAKWQIDHGKQDGIAWWTIRDRSWANKNTMFITTTPMGQWVKHAALYTKGGIQWKPHGIDCSEHPAKIGLS